MAVARFKGTVYESTRMFTEKEFGRAAVAKVLGKLSESDRAVLTGINTLGWYPVEPVLRYHHELDRTFGTGDLSICVQAGRFSAGWAFNTVLKLFLRFRSPSWLVGRATSVWDRYHDTGQWEIESPGENRLIGHLHDFAVRDLAFCARLRGWLQGALELTGGERPVVIETQCACRGADHCTFSLSWQT